MGNTSEHTIYHRAYVMGNAGNSISFPVGLTAYALSLQKNPLLHYSNTPVFLLLQLMGGGHVHYKA